MSAAATGRGIAGRLAGRRRPRLFAMLVEEPRARRATDAVLLVAAAVGLTLLGSIAVPQAGFERALIALARSLPGGLDGLWRLLMELLTVAAVALVVATLVRRRAMLLRDLLLAVGMALAASLAVGRTVHGRWPAIWDALGTAAPSSWSPTLRLAIGGAVVMTASPHLAQLARRQGRWLVVLAAAGVVLLGAATASTAAAGVLVAAMSAAAVHLAFGSSGGRPSLADVAAALGELGVATRSLGAAARQLTGLFLVDVVDERGDPLVVKVYGRDAYDTQLLRTLWRIVWYREAGSPLSVGRLQQVEHEAFLTLLAGQVGIPTQQVVTAGATAEDDVLLVLRPVGQQLETVPDRWTEATAGRVWGLLRRLQDIGIAHGQVDDRHLVVDGDEVGLLDFRGATVAPAKERMRTDEAQTLVTTVLALGEGPALMVAVEALGAGCLAAVLPFVQPPALTPLQRGRVR